MFLCFTLSQAGMVRHWLRERGSGWRPKLVVNGAGALVTALVTLVVVGTKFTQGAWLVVVLVPLLIAGFSAIHRHYAATRRALSEVAMPREGAVRNLVVIPVVHLDRALMATLDYARATSTSVLALHVESDEEAATRLRERWPTWVRGVPLEVVPSPYRDVVAPLLDALRHLRRTHPDCVVTVMLPEVVPRHWWQEPLHNQTGLALKLSLLHEPGVVVTSVPTHL